nr:phenol hydroxylase subunit P4 [uncultured Pseudomonas sp.]
MSVTAIGDYSAEPLDLQRNFHGAQLVYVCWEHHLLFCAPFTFPVPPEMAFDDFLLQVLTPAISVHPDAPSVDFSRARWRLNDTPFFPDNKISLSANGIAHKSLLHLLTPGLDGLSGSGS